MSMAAAWSPKQIFPLGTIKFILNLEKVAAAAASGFFNHEDKWICAPSLFWIRELLHAQKKKKSIYVTPKQDPEALNMPCLTFARIQPVLLQQTKGEKQPKQGLQVSHTAIHPNTLIFTVYLNADVYRRMILCLLDKSWWHVSFQDLVLCCLYRVLPHLEKTKWAWLKTNEAGTTQKTDIQHFLKMIILL